MASVIWQQGLMAKCLYPCLTAILLALQVKWCGMVVTYVHP